MARNTGGSITRRLISLLRRQGGTARPENDAMPRRRLAPSWAALEALEDRKLLAAINWTGGGVADTWNDPANWSLARVPNTFDQVFVADPGLTITVDGAASVGTLSSLAGLSFAPGSSLFVAGLGTVGAAVRDITMTGGSIAGGDPDGAGPLVAATLSAGGIAISNAQGPVTFNSIVITSAISVGDESAPSNFTEATFSGGGLFGALDIADNAAFDSSGGWAHTGPFAMGSGASGTFASGVSLDALSMGTGATLNFPWGGDVSGAASIAGTVTVGAQLNFLGVVDLVGGAITGDASPRFAGTINWSAGTIGGVRPTVPVGGTLNILTAQPKFAAALDTFALEGTTNWSGTGIIGAAPAPSAINVLNTGTMNVTAAGIAGFHMLADDVMNTAWFINDGNVVVSSGSTFRAEGGDHAGDFTIAAGGLLDLSGGGISPTGSISGAGSARLAFNTASWGAVTIGGTLTVLGGTFENDVSASTLLVGEEFSPFESGLAWFKDGASITGNVTLYRGHASFGTPIWQFGLTVAGSLNVLKANGEVGGGLTVHGDLVVPSGVANFQTGVSTIHGSLVSPNAPTLGGGTLKFLDNVLAPGQHWVFGGTWVEFVGDVQLGAASFVDGKVWTRAGFAATADPVFAGADVEFHGSYLVPRDSLHISSGSVGFLNPDPDPSTNADEYRFRSIVIGNGAKVFGTTDRTSPPPQSGPLPPIKLVATETFDWQGGTIWNLDVEAAPNVTVEAGGGTKRFVNTFDQNLYQTRFAFATMNWTSGDIEVDNNTLFGNSALAAEVVKSGPGNFVTTATIHPPIGEDPEYHQPLMLGLFDHTYGGVTTIEGRWSPYAGSGHMRVRNGEVQLPEYAFGPYYQANAPNGTGQLVQGEWTIGGLLTLPDADIQTIAAGVTARFDEPGGRFPAVESLSTNRGTLIFEGGRIADHDSFEPQFSNHGILSFSGTDTAHSWQSPIINDGQVFLLNGADLTVPRIKGAGLVYRDPGSVLTVLNTEGPNTAVLDFSGLTPFTGPGTVQFIGDFETIFNNDALIEGAFITDLHRFSGSGAVTFTGTLQYHHATIAPGGGSYRLGLFGSAAPLDGGSMLTLERTFHNDGAFDAEVVLAAGALLQNNSTGILTVRGVQGAGSLHNAGRIRTAPGAATRTIGVPLTQTGTAPFELDDADLHIPLGVINQSTLAVVGTKSLNLGGVVANSGAVAFDGAGAIRFDQDARIEFNADTEVRSATLVLQDETELAGPGIVTLMGQIAYDELDIGPGGTLIIGAGGALTPASGLSRLVLDRAVTVHGLLAGPIETERAGVITIESTGILDLDNVTGLGSIINRGLIRNVRGGERAITVPLFHESSQRFGMDGTSNIRLQGGVLNTGAFGASGSATLSVQGEPMIMTGGTLGGDGDIRVHSSLLVSGGALVSSSTGAFLVVEAGALFTIDHDLPGFMPFDARILNLGLTVWERGSLAGAGNFTNYINATLILAADEGDFSWSRSGSSTAKITNDGTVIRFGLAGTQYLLIPLDNRPGSSLHVFSGDLGVLRGGTWDTGAIVEPGSTLTLGSASGEPTMLLKPSAAVTGGGNLTFGGLGFDGSTTVNSAVNIGGNLTILSGSNVFNFFVVGGGDVRVLGGSSSFNSVAFFQGFGTFTGGTLNVHGAASILGTALFSGAAATFGSSFACQNAEFQAGTVTFEDTFTTNLQEPAFTGGHVRFGGLYDAPTAHLLIQGGSARFDDNITFGHVELLGGDLLGDPARTTAQGATRFQVSDHFDWGGGTITDLDFSVGPLAFVDAFGGAKRVAFTAAAGLMTPMRFYQINWSGGDIDLRDGASLDGFAILKTGPGNLTASLSDPQSPLRSAVRASHFRHEYAGPTTVSAQWDPDVGGQFGGRMHVVSGTITLTDRAEFVDGAVLSHGDWLVESAGTLIMPGDPITATGTNTSITLFGPLSTFNAISTLALNGGWIILNSPFAFTPAGASFVNDGELFLAGNLTHTPLRQLINGGITHVVSGSTLQLNLPATNAGTFDVWEAATLNVFTTVTHSGPQAYTGSGAAVFSFDSAQVFTADTTISLGSMSHTLGPHWISGNAVVRVNSDVVLGGREYTIGTGVTYILEPGHTFTGSGGIIVGSAFENRGVISGPGITVSVGGLLTSTSEGAITLVGQNIAGLGSFHNYGTLSVTGAHATIGTSEYAHFSLEPFSVAAGVQLTMTSSTGFNFGTMSVVGGGSLAFSQNSSASFVHASANPLAGSGLIHLGRDRTHTFTLASTLSATNLSLDLTTLSGPGSVLLTGTIQPSSFTTSLAGGFTVAPGGLIQGDPFSRVTTTTTLTNHGAISNTNPFVSGATALLINSPTGVITLGASPINGTGTFRNEGSIVVTSTSSISTPIYNHASVIPFTVAPGQSLHIRSDSGTNSGTMSVGGGGSLAFIDPHATSFTHTSAEPFAGGGTITLGSQRTHTFNGNSTISGTDIQPNSATLTGPGSVTLTGRMVGGAWNTSLAGGFTVAPQGTIESFGASTFTVSTTLTNQGRILNSYATIQGADALFINAPAGLITLADDRQINGTGTFDNRGEVRATHGFAYLSASIVRNTGRIRVQGGVLGIPSGLAEVSGNTLTGGTLSVHNGQLNLPASIQTIGPGARVELTHVNAVFAALNPLSTVSGVFSLRNGRGFSTAGNLTVGGVMNLDTGTLSVNGAFTMLATGTLGSRIASPTLYGRVIATGTATLSGIIRVDFAYFPQPTHSFRLLQAAAVSGTFSQAWIGSTSLINDPTGITLRVRPPTPEFEPA